jgi:hypothetical protein
MEPNGGSNVPQCGNGRPPEHAGQAAAFGEFLRTRREQSGKSLDDVSAQTKFQPRHFQALERGDVDALPRGMYARAMLRAYSESVGLDTRQVVDHFQEVFKPPTEDPIAAIAAALPAPRRRARRQPPAMLLTGLAGLVIGAAIFFATRVSGPGDPAPPLVVPARAVARPADIALPSAPEEVVPAAARAEAPAGTAGRAAPAKAAMPRATDGTLFVTSDPPGARVTVNGIGWGETPLTIRYLPFGSKRVRAVMPGYASVERSIRLDGGQPRATVNIRLRPQARAGAK